MRRHARLSVIALALVAWLLPAGARAGDPTFTVGPTIAVASAAFLMQSEDLNHDGATDVVVCDRFGTTVSIWFGSGTGSFTFGATYPVVGGPYSAVIYSANGDAHPDVSVCTA